MGRDLKSSCKKCRRNREKLFLKGERCFTAKCAIEKRNTPPGPRALRPPKLSEYGRRLREKQKLRFFYGVSERKIRQYFKDASQQSGITGHNLLSLFEKRIDNILYRTFTARSRKEARQLVRHNHIKLNGKKINVASIIVKVGDTLSIKSSDSDRFKIQFKELEEKTIPTWLSFNKKEKTFTVLSEPTREEVDVPVEEHLIVEYYSK